MADVLGLYGQALGVVEPADGLENSGEYAFVSGVVLVQLCLWAKMMDKVL